MQLMKDNSTLLDTIPWCNFIHLKDLEWKKKKTTMWYYACHANEYTL